jgi:Zn-dependent peptidase ImmA (M78 family)/DNA-binding XRE family transcriptional regulator
MTELNQIDPKFLGQRLTEARKARGVTQEDAAKHLGCSRPILIAIEKGTRPAKAEELLKLASLYGRSVHELLRPGEPLVDLQPHLRAVAGRTESENPELTQAIGELQRFVEDYRQLERLMNAPLKLNYPPEIQLSSHINPHALAEDVAVQERQRLGLGDQPIIDLRNILETEVGLRIIYESLPSPIAGMFAYVGDFGGVIAVNRKHPPERRRATMLHEYGHLLVDRHKPGIDYLATPTKRPANERFAETFSMAFLMPTTSVRRRFNEIVNSTSDFQVADLCRLSHLYFVSLEAMTLRLEGMGLIPQGTREHLKESRFEVRKATEVLSLPKHPANDEPLSDRYKYLAVHAYERGELSEGQLARFLRCDPVTARETVARYLTTPEVSLDGEYLAISAQAESQFSLLTDAK